MHRLIPINTGDDIPPEHRDTPVGRLLAYHNLGRPFPVYTHAEMLIGMCMDNRKNLRIPPDFAFVLRTAGANMRDNEFRISFAIGVGGVRAMALIAHTDCGMARLAEREEAFVRGLVENAGWTEAQARRHYAESAPRFAIKNEVDFVLGEADRLRALYPKLTITPLLYRVEDDRLYLIREP